MTQEQFQFALVSMEFDEEFMELTYGEKWENTPSMYKEFKKSPYFDPEKDEVVCIINYIKQKNLNV